MTAKTDKSGGGGGGGTRNMVENLLSEIYTQYQIHNQLDSSTETSCFSDGIHVNFQNNLHSMETKERFQLSNLNSNHLKNLIEIKEELEQRVVVVSAKLVRQLKQRSRLKDKNTKHCDTVTAVLQAVSQKRWVDAQLKFTLEPLPGSRGFKQWSDALRAIIQLPDGLPACWRKRIWLNIAENHFKTKHNDLDWVTIKSWVFSDRVCATDETLGNQIVKDLHRTGYSNIISDEAENKNEDRLLLKRVLLAYARWNKEIGYCQGFNVIAALLLQVTEGDDEAAFKIMVYLIDQVLPENYFSNNLQALSVDMAVFRDMLKFRLPQLSQLLDNLQKEANENVLGSNYEPPLTNVFTMQWFLTLFATFLPLQTVLRVWDSLIVDGNEILIRVALAVWTKLNDKVSKSQSADEFYSIMSKQMQDASSGQLIDDDQLVMMIYKLAPFPFPRLDQLREKYTYNITPFLTSQADENTATSGDTNRRQSASITPQDDVDVTTFSCFTGLINQSGVAVGNRKTLTYNRGQQNLELATSTGFPSNNNKPGSMLAERMSTDITSLKQQYLAIRARQANAHLICTKPINDRSGSSHDGSMISYFPNNSASMMNHLLVGRDSNFNSALTSTVPIQLQQSERHSNKKRKQRY